MTPQIGYYTAECCLMDLHKITSEDELRAVQERIAESDECGPLMVFETLAQAVAQFRGELSPEDEARELARLRDTINPI